MGKIQFHNVVKKYDKQVIVDHMTLTIPEQSFTVILGPSGCGKSTLLRLISGLEDVDAGDIFINDRNVTNLKPKDRKIAMVFQNYALYPHMSVNKNVEYSLKIQGMPKEKRREVVSNALKLVELQDQANKLPAQMSGGQRQRVALARAMVKSPSAYLLDEPLSNLDARLRNQMRQMISQLHTQLKKTFVYVTHDQVEAMSLGHHIIILNKGKIMQQGTPKEIYTNPTNVFVAKFIGSPPANVLPFNNNFAAIRAEHILITPPEHTKCLKLEGSVLTFEQLGSEVIYTLNTQLGKLLVKLENDWTVKEDNLVVYLPLNQILYFNENEKRIYKTEELEHALCFHYFSPL